MREGIQTTLWITAWLTASALWYFRLWDTLPGLLAGLTVAVGIPLAAFISTRTR